MNRRTGQQIGAILLLALFAWLAVRSSLAVGSQELTGGQRAVALLQWWYAVLAAIAIVGLIARHNGTRLVLFAWAAIFVTRNALAPLYFGGKTAALALAGGLVGLGIAAGILYLAFQALAPAQDDAAP